MPLAESFTLWAKVAGCHQIAFGDTFILQGSKKSTSNLYSDNITVTLALGSGTLDANGSVVLRDNIDPSIVTPTRHFHVRIAPMLHHFLNQPFKFCGRNLMQFVFDFL